MNINTVRNTAMLQVLGLLIYLKMTWNGFRPKKRTQYNKNAYKAYLAMRPMVANMKWFKVWVKLGILCAALLIATALIPWMRETHILSLLSGIGVLSLVTGIWFYRKAIRESVDGDTVELGEAFERFMSGILSTFIEKLDTRLSENNLLDVSTCPEGYAPIVYDVATKLVHVLALNQTQDEACSKARYAFIRQERLLAFLNKLAMIGAWPDREDKQNRGSLLGKLYAWAEAEYKFGNQVPFELPVLPLQAETGHLPYNAKISPKPLRRR